MDTQTENGLLKTEGAKTQNKKITFLDDQVEKPGAGTPKHVRFGLNEQGEKVFLKTSPMLVTSEKSQEVSPVSPEDVDFIGKVNEDVQTISHIGRYLNVPIPKAEAIYVNETPWIMMEDLGNNLKDVHVDGNGLTIPEQPESLAKFEADMAKIAFYKAILDHRAIDPVSKAGRDDGQFIQKPSGEVYMSDCEQFPTSEAKTPIALFNQLSEQVLQGGGYFVSDEKTRHHQINGLSSAEFKQTLETAKGTDVGILKFTDKQLKQEPPLTELMAGRISSAAVVFEVLGQNPNLTEAMFKPSSDEAGKQQANAARMELFQKIKAVQKPS